MKIRTDFVTNSSSSSFILAFKNEEDFGKMLKCCAESDYKPAGKLLQRCRQRAEGTMDEIKAKALEEIRHYLTWQAASDYCKARINQELPFVDKMHEETRIRETAEFKEFVEAQLRNTRYAEYEKRIMDAEFIISDTIWDSSGGILEYAIRHGLFRTFYPWFVYQEDIG